MWLLCPPISIIKHKTFKCFNKRCFPDRLTPHTSHLTPVHSLACLPAINCLTVRLWSHWNMGVNKSYKIRLQKYRQHKWPIQSNNMSENLSRFLLILVISLSVTIIGLVLITTEVRPESLRKSKSNKNNTYWKVGRSEIKTNSTYFKIPTFSTLMSLNKSVVKSRDDSLDSRQMKVNILSVLSH